MDIHIIIDFMHIYYKYYFQLKAGRIKRLKTAIDWKGTTIEKDMSLIYYPLRAIEGIRSQWESNENKVTISICMDSPSKRAELEGGEEYKANRQKTLSDTDYENIEYLLGLADKAGHNLYKYDGYEADDIVNYLVRHYKDEYDFTIIYTNDKDLLINIGDTVGVMRFKQGHGYDSVGVKNYEHYLKSEFKASIPYNMLGLFLASVGDSSDRVHGINKFGAKSFEKMLNQLLEKHPEIDTAKCGDYEYLKEISVHCAEILKPEQYKELQIGLQLVSNMDMSEDVPKPTKVSTSELREAAYLPYQMYSLIS